MSNPRDEGPAYLGDCAHARNDGGEMIIYTDRREFDAHDNEIVIRHWISLEPKALRELVAYADRTWPGWRKA